MAKPANTRRYRRRTLRVLVEYLSADGLRCETATTLGAGGMFVETPDPLVEGSLVELCFSLPDGGLRHTIRSRVAWAQSPLEPGGCTSGMGLEFVDRAAAGRLAREIEGLD